MSKIELQSMTPSPYYTQSRDFQFIGRLFDIVLNSVKTNADMIYNLPLSANSDRKLIDLMALTLGFKLKHNYAAAQLVALCSTFSEILRNKGSVYAVELAANTLIHAEGLKTKFKYDLDVNNAKIIAYLPSGLSNLSLFRDILDYILPAGMRCDIVVANFTEQEATTEVGTIDTHIARNRSDDANMLADVLNNNNWPAASIYSNNSSGYIGTGGVVSKKNES